MQWESPLCGWVIWSFGTCNFLVKRNLWTLFLRFCSFSIFFFWISVRKPEFCFNWIGCKILVYQFPWCNFLSFHLFLIKFMPFKKNNNYNLVRNSIQKQEQVRKSRASLKSFELYIDFHTFLIKKGVQNYQLFFRKTWFSDLFLLRKVLRKIAKFWSSRPGRLIVFGKLYLIFIICLPYVVVRLIIP